MDKNNLGYVIRIVLSILILSLLVDRIVFYSLTKISDNVYSGESIGKINHYIQIKDDIDFIVFGSSRAVHHVDPELISSNGFNMGVNGKKIAFVYTLIKMLPKDKHQTILVHIDPELASDSTYFGNDIGALSVKYRHNDIIKNEIDYLDQDKFFQKIYWSIAYNGYVFGILRNYFDPKYDYRNYNGYDPIKVSDTQKEIFRSILANEEKAVCPKDYQLNSLYHHYLQEIYQLSLTHNKQLLLYTSPEYNDQCKGDNELMTAYLEEIGIPYYDFSDYFKENNNLEYWKDRGHLSIQGAEIFSRELRSLVHGPSNKGQNKLAGRKSPGQ